MKVLFGYQIPTGEPVYLTPQHLAIFGMTQLSGKTTACEGMISRSGTKALAFITKRGEKGFRDFNEVQPILSQQRGWRYVESLVDVALGEKVKYEPRMRFAIMNVSKISKNVKGLDYLRQVRVNANNLLQKAKKQWDKEVYSKLGEYLDIVLPNLEGIEFAEKLELVDGINVMNLSDYQDTPETQQLLIADAMLYIHVHLSGVVTIIPEAWESLPQFRSTPIKWVAERLIRQGASIQNFVYLDTQDIGGISKTPLRQVSTWIIGRMMEAHEVERLLKQLLGLKIPAKEIQTLPLGHFYVVHGNKVVKAYALPVGVPEEIGIKVAKGELTSRYVQETYLKPKKESDEDLYKEKYLKLKKEFDEFKKGTNLHIKTLKEKPDEQQQEIKQLEDHYQSELGKVMRRNDELVSEVEQLRPLKQLRDSLLKILPNTNSTDVNVSPEMIRTEIKEAIKELLPKIIDLEHIETTYNIKHSEESTKLTTKTQQGQIMFVALNDLKGKEFTETEISQALLQRSWNIKHTSLAPTLGGLAKTGLLIRIPKTRPTRYTVPSKVKINVL